MHVPWSVLVSLFLLPLSWPWPWITVRGIFWRRRPVEEHKWASWWVYGTNYIMYSHHTGLDEQKNQCQIVNIFLPIIFSICFGCSKEPSHWDGSFEHPQHMFWLRNKKNNYLLCTLHLSPASFNLSLSCYFEYPKHIFDNWKIITTW